MSRSAVIVTTRSSHQWPARDMSCLHKENITFAVGACKRSLSTLVSTLTPEVFFVRSLSPRMTYMMVPMQQSLYASLEENRAHSTLHTICEAFGKSDRSVCLQGFRCVGRVVSVAAVADLLPFSCQASSAASVAAAARCFGGSMACCPCCPRRCCRCSNRCPRQPCGEVPPTAPARHREPGRSCRSCRCRRRAQRGPGLPPTPPPGAPPRGPRGRGSRGPWAGLPSASGTRAERGAWRCRSDA